MWGLLALIAAAFFALTVADRPTLPGPPSTSQTLDQILLWQSIVPRAATALLAGAALGLAGALLQRVLRNPIADPSTLGIASGAQLALTAATVWGSVLAAVPRELIAFAGGLAAVGLVLVIGWKRGLEPVMVVLSGMTISLMASAFSAALVLANGDYVLSLFVWGAGSLQQQSWDAAITLAVRLVLGLGAALLLLRPLALLALDDASARSLGLAITGTRLVLIALAVWLAASVTAEVGIIGFVGLAAPALARLSGARSPRQMLAAAPVIGALTLWLADGMVQVASISDGELMPTGAATGLLGGPLLLWLLPRLRVDDRPIGAQMQVSVRRRRAPWQTIGWLAFAAVPLVLLSLSFGRDYGGWQLAHGQLFADLLPFRAPRMLAAAAAGALLAAAGTLMQRLTGNPLAGPEVLGVGAGAGVGLAAVLLLTASPGLTMMMAGCTAGAIAAVLAILAISASVGLRPEHLLLAGIAIGALSLAILSAVFATGAPNVFILLTWMSGSTDRFGIGPAAAALAAAVAFIAPLTLAGRWLDILPLGDDVGRSLGLAVRTSRITLAFAAALMAAIASLIVGPLSLVGLIGPHLARLSGFARGTHQLVASALIGAELMILVDWLGRTIAFPYQIPAGLLAAVVGGSYLIWLLRRTGG
ncbi:Fe(3+)-hydroxamate ABC transporter permease FhuB [Amorphus sp. 3PC139-8]